MEQNIAVKHEQIPLNLIRPNPANPRKNFAGKPFDELVASIAEQGVLQPIMVRPVADRKARYEIIFGERRFQACLHLAKQNGGTAAHTIPAMVRELGDEDSFEIMTIENLQRADITELEEAKSFQEYLKKKGEQGLLDFASRCGISPSYVRRRLMVLDLPARVLKAWDQGKVLFGHLEQLARLKDKDAVDRFFDDITGWKKLSVADLRASIDGRSPALKKARFDTASCSTCFHNSSVQVSLFEMELDKETKCNNPKCYRDRQSEWLTANWHKSRLCGRGELRTTGFVFIDDLSGSNYHIFWEGQRRSGKCPTCEHYKTVIKIDGEIRYPAVCFGDKACFTKATTAPPRGREKQEPAGGDAAPRVSWHGEHFREEFFAEALPGRIRDKGLTHADSFRLALFSLVASNPRIQGWFTSAYIDPSATEEQLGIYYHINQRQLWAAVRGMDQDVALTALQEATIRTVLHRNEIRANVRREMAVHFGVDLAAEWKVTAAYCAKKTTAELQQFCERFAVWDDPEFRSYVQNTLKKDPDKLKALKKAELTKALLKSGCRLAGLVPDEVLAETEDPFDTIDTLVGGMDEDEIEEEAA